MNTIIAKAGVDDDRMYEQAAEILKRGGLVAFPTETVYGLGGDALNPDASHRIYAAKGRPSDNPLIVHIAETSSVYELAETVSDDTKKLMEAFWPGPLTIILNKKEVVPHTTTGGLDTVAIRMPSHPVAMRLIKDSGVYIAAPSANLSGRPSPTTAQHVQQDMDDSGHDRGQTDYITAWIYHSGDDKGYRWRCDYRSGDNRYEQCSET